jgi:murein L,D-transpeptidase YcbB/YkuD
MSRATPARAALLSLLALALGGCRGAGVPGSRSSPAPASPGPSPSSPASPASATAPAPPTPTATPAPDEVASTVDKVLADARHPRLRWPDLSDVVEPLRDLYGGQPARLVWFDGDRPRVALAPALAAVAGAADRALDPADYDAERLQAEWKRLQGGSPVSAPDRALFDLALSVAVLREMGAVHHGRVDPRTLGWAYDVAPKKLDRAALLVQARDGQGVPALLDSLEPSYAHYAWLRKALARYRGLAQAGEPPAVPDLPKGRRKIEPGQTWDGLEPLRARLLAVGDLAPDAPQLAPADGAPPYEGPLVDAVKRFQARHLLDADGVIGPATIAALNVPVAARVRQLELAMERARWLPPVDKQPTIFVNIPMFSLWATDPVGGKEPLNMKVVVGGSLENQTPVFVQDMGYVTFRPYWNVPTSIAAKEIVPHARRDPSWLDRQGFEIVASYGEDAGPLPVTSKSLDEAEGGTLLVRQKPGPRNALGLVKFVFPNHENVYLHGTPSRSLFRRARRDLSHGCIRVEHPTKLAEWVLRDVPGWDRAHIEEAMQGEQPTSVKLKAPLMVVLFYDTVQVAADGSVSFANDIYGHDAQLAQALARGYPYPEAPPPPGGKTQARGPGRVSSSSSRGRR